MKRNFKSGRGIGEDLLTSMGAIRGFRGVRGRTILNQAENFHILLYQASHFFAQSYVEGREATMYVSVNSHPIFLA